MDGLRISLGVEIGGFRLLGHVVRLTNRIQPTRWRARLMLGVIRQMQRMIRIRRIGQLSALMGAFCLLCWGCCGPSTYDDCVLEHVKEGMNVETVVLLMGTCRSKFPREEAEVGTGEPDLRDLTSAELAKLSGRAWHMHRLGNVYGGNIYNGNSNLKIRRLEIVLQTTFQGEPTSRTYFDEVSIDPYTTEDFRIEIVTGDDGTGYDWSITGAKGIPIE